jgi:hypothetical protein
MYAHRKVKMKVKIIENRNHNPVINKNITGHRFSRSTVIHRRISGARIYAMNSARAKLVLPSTFRYRGETRIPA